MPIKIEKVERPVRLRRSCHAVPGSSEKMLEKSAGLDADQVFLDLEDAVALDMKEEARGMIINALKTYDYKAPTVVVRVNAVDTKFAYRDLIEVVEAAGEKIDCIMIPKVESAEHITFIDRLLTSIEETKGWEVGRIGLEAQIENGEGLLNIEKIAAASPRMETLILGPGDFSAAMGMRILSVGGNNQEYPGDIWHYVNFRILSTARAFGLQAIDGPYSQVKNDDGLREAAVRTVTMGFDGKWSLHPQQIPVINELFSPPLDQYQRAERMLAAYEHATTVEKKGAVMFENEMIDEANRKMALELALKGRLIGLEKGESWTPPTPEGEAAAAPAGTTA
ncbi:MAG TPA: CoA ester lyase [Solirubrobacterales bacterium]|jgi:citrate lyase subunit beta/citryl-CoA lyase|nr:CoA ester lyase [Solirubrobacterales bacterium]